MTRLQIGCCSFIWRLGQPITLRGGGYPHYSLNYVSAHYSGKIVYDGMAWLNGMTFLFLHKLLFIIHFCCILCVFFSFSVAYSVFFFEILRLSPSLCFKQHKQLLFHWESTVKPWEEGQFEANLRSWQSPLLPGRSWKEQDGWIISVACRSLMKQ